MSQDSTGKNRAKLSKTLDDLLAGRITIETAKAAKGILNAISENMKAEVEVGKLMLEAKKPLEEFGTLGVGDPSILDRG